MCAEVRSLPGRLLRFIVVSLGLLLLLGDVGRARGVGETVPVRTLLAVRYEGVVRQTDWYTCGPAAVATLLRYYFGVDVGEAETVAVAAAVSRELGVDVADGFSALALVRTLERFGVPTLGYRVSVEALTDYFRRGGLPVILHVTRPERHYVVAVGMAGDYVLVADPSWGRRIERWEQFAADKGFSGVVLVPVPSGEQAARARAAQQEAVAGMVDKLRFLSSAAGRVAGR